MKLVRKLKDWLLRRLIREHIQQSGLYPGDPKHIFHATWMACREEFSEDNEATLRSYLQDRFDQGCQDPIEKSTG